MLTVHYDANLCVMTKFSNLIAGKWKPIILHLIEENINRFSKMQSHMPAISKKMLTEQLRELETDGLIKRQELKSKVPKIVVYHLTPKGTSLRKLIDEIISWSMEYLMDEISIDSIEAYMKTYPELAKKSPWLTQTCRSHLISR